MMREIESVPPFDTKKIAIDPALVTIIPAPNFHAGVRSAHAQRGFAPVGAMSARRAHVLHLPGTRLVAIRPGSQRPDRTNINAHAALFAIQMIVLIGCNDRTDTAVLHAQSPYIHALAANPHAAIAKNATRPVKENYRRPLLLFFVILGVDVFGFGGT